MPGLTTAPDLKPCQKLLLCLGGGPKTEAQLGKFRESLAQRYHNQQTGITDWDEAQRYVERINDRLINKARGLLTFNGLTVASIAALHSLNKAVIFGPVVMTLSVSLAIASACILLLTHFPVKFHTDAGYQSFKDDFELYAVIIVTRSKWLWLSISSSLLSILLIPADRLLTLLSAQ